MEVSRGRSVRALEEANRSGLLDGRNLAQFAKHFLRNFHFDVNDGDGPFCVRGLAVGEAASEREVGDVDLVLAENRANFADHAGDVAIPQVDEIALERSFDIDAIDVEQTG